MVSWWSLVLLFLCLLLESYQKKKSLHQCLKVCPLCFLPAISVSDLYIPMSDFKVDHKAIFLLVSVAQEYGCSIAACLWIKMCYEIVLKLSDSHGLIWKLNYTEDSKFTPLVPGSLGLLSRAHLCKVALWLPFEFLQEQKSRRSNQRKYPKSN